MIEQIEMKYVNEKLGIGLTDVRQAYLLFPTFQPPIAEVHKGKLVYKAKCSNKRISYTQVKKGLRKQKRIVEQEIPDWLW